ncbi:hypothetical protein CK203_104646 [Vitis vinifera]|uniref:Uncharacterized protein n=1 Tax=Vitis vinifera TaxID=29760 RepID=A0A438DMI4_VITVI|nr:hypothetical protein CK203_104646 [Vitis vinifera]
MDPVVMNIVGQDSPRKVEESKATSLEGKDSSRTAFLPCIISHEFFSPEVWRASVAELLGTAVLVFVLDTIVISSYQTKTETPNLVISFFIFPTLTILLLATFPISGGAVLGALALKAVVNSNIEETFSLGGCTLSVIVPGPDGAITVVWIGFDDRQAKALGLVLVCSIIGAVAGVLVFVSTTVTATKGYAGAGMNPARCLGAALVRGGQLWNGLWVFWVGPAIACLLFYVYVKTIRDLPPWTEMCRAPSLPL